MRTARLVLMKVCVLAASAAAAQNLEVSLSPISPGARQFTTHEALTTPLGAFRFAAVSSPGQIDGLVVTGAGTGNFAKDLEPSTGIQAWLDDGNGQFGDQTDVQLSATSGALPTMTLTFASPVAVAPGTSIDVWIIVAVKELPSVIDLSEVPVNRSFAVSITAENDVLAPGATVGFTASSPETPFVTLTLPPAQHVTTTCVVSAGDGTLGWRLIVPVLLVVVVRVRRKSWLSSTGAS